jgi:hypothetical protein
MTPAYANQFLCGELWHIVKRLGPCPSSAVCKASGKTIQVVSKLLGKMVARGYLKSTAVRRDRLYSINKLSQPPKDGRQARLRVRPPPVVRSTVPELGRCWPWPFPYGLEGQYCVRLDARVGKLCPQNTQAAD